MGTFFRDFGRALRAPYNKAVALNRLKAFHDKKRTLDEVIDSAMNLSTHGHYRVNSVQIRSEILSLAKAVEAIKPKVILEIGTCNAGTLFIWSNIAGKKVVTCDLSVNKRREQLYGKFPPYDSKCEVVALEGDSHSPDFRKRVEQELSGEKVDFLFIDGDHSENGVEADYNDYHHLVRPGGLIAFHDIVKEQPVPGNQVYYFWTRLKEKADTEEFVNDPKQCGYGIGIVRVK